MISLPYQNPAHSPNFNLIYCLLACHTDPYHTYLSIAASSIVSPDPAWELQPLDPLINATYETAKWAKEHIPVADAPTLPEPKR
jgi:hypothetical protein